MGSGTSVRKYITTSTPVAVASMPGAPTPTTAGFGALSRFVVGNSMVAEVKAACRECPHRVDRTGGVDRREVQCPLDGPQEIWLMTHWRLADDHRAWDRGRAYKDSRRGIPKGLRLVGRESCIHEFEVVCE
jgi:heme oxygenase (mycobilin-producing)